MTDSKGSILQLKEKQAIVMTDTCDFITVKRRPDMFVGQQITYRKSDIHRSGKFNLRAASLIASVFILALCTIFYLQVYNPASVYAYIDVDINPSLEFSIDKNSRVTSVTDLNQDASKLLSKLDLKGLPVKDAIVKVVEASKDQGFIAVGKENAVLISAAVNKKNPNHIDDAHLDILLKELNQLDLGTVDNATDTDKLQSEIMKVSPDVRDSALSNKISMGRYILYTKIKEDKKDITLEKAKTERVSEMLKEAKVKDDEKDKSSKKDKALENSVNENKDSTSIDDNKDIKNNGNKNGKNSDNKNSNSGLKEKIKKKTQQIDDSGDKPRETDGNTNNVKEKEKKKTNDSSASPSGTVTEKDYNNNSNNSGSSDQSNLDQGLNGNKPEQPDKKNNSDNNSNGKSKDQDNQSDKNNNDNQGKNGNKK